MEGRLECDRCHKPIDDNDRKKDGLAECKECGLVFDLLLPPPPPPITKEDPLPSRRPLGRKRPQVKIPHRFDVEFEKTEPLPLKPSAIKSMMKMLPYREAAQEMLVSKKKSRPHARAFIRIKPEKVEMMRFFFACVLFPVIGLGAATMAHIVGATWLVIGLVAFFGIGTVLRTRKLLRLHLNATTIRLKDGLLQISIGPIGSIPPVTILADDIEQIWTRRIRTSGGLERFNVELTLSNGTGRVLIEGLEEADQALYIEQELEYALGLIDVAVAMEPDSVRAAASSESESEESRPEGCGR